MSINSSAIQIDEQNTGGITENEGFILMAYESTMLEQASMNNKNWIKLDEYLAKINKNIDCGTWN